MKQSSFLSHTPSRNPAWIIYVHDGQLFVSAGADRVYLVDELNVEQVTRFHHGYLQNNWESLQQEPVYQAVIEKLVTLGVLYYAGSAQRLLRVALQWAGEPSQALTEWLDTLFKRRGDIEIASASSSAADLVLIIRTNGTLQDVATLSSEEIRPHLLLDLAYHSALVVGPFVVPGQTACLGCLAGRLTHLWGDSQPPAQPAMNTRIELAAAVITEHLESFRTRGTINALVGNSWALDTATWESRFHPVFRLPWCPICATRQQTKAAGRLTEVF